MDSVYEDTGLSVSVYGSQIRCLCTSIDLQSAQGFFVVRRKTFRFINNRDIFKKRHFCLVFTFSFIYLRMRGDNRIVCSLLKEETMGFLFGERSTYLTIHYYSLSQNDWRGFYDIPRRNVLQFFQQDSVILP